MAQVWCQRTRGIRNPGRTPVAGNRSSPRSAGDAATRRTRATQVGVTSNDPQEDATFGLAFSILSALGETLCPRSLITPTGVISEMR